MHTREEKLEQFGRLLDIMDNLRERCPWNAEQTMASIRPMTEEEVYELSDEIVKHHTEGVCKEIGDLLYHMVFYARIAQEEGLFDIADSIDKICAKMIFRHPHVFRADGSLIPEGEAPSAKEIADTWELVKAKEKGGNRTVMGGIPDTMPALLRALSMQEKARGCGFDWEKKEDVWAKVREEVEEVEEAAREAAAAAVEAPAVEAPAVEAPATEAPAAEAPAANHLEEEFGDLLFATINAARLYGVDPEVALSSACSKFRRRFTYLEENTLKKGLKFSDMTLAQMDAIWDEAKAKGL